MSEAGRSEFDPFERIEHGARVWIGGHDREARRLIELRLSGLDTSRPIEGPIDAAFITPLDMDEAVYFLQKLLPRLTPDARVGFVCSVDRNSGAAATCSPSEKDWNALLRPYGWSVAGIAQADDTFVSVTARRTAR